MTLTNCQDRCAPASGFSQGAALASLLLAQGQQQGACSGVKFAILVCFCSPANCSVPRCLLPFTKTCFVVYQAGAFLPKDPKYAQSLTSLAIDVPTLFVCGEKDQYISPERTEEIIRTFEPQSVQRFVHKGGHMVPTCTGRFKKSVQEFLDAHKTL